MGETEVTTKDTLPAGGQSSGGKEGSTSKQAPETYTREQMQKFVSDALSEQGRKHKAELEPIVKERDGFKSQVEANTSDLEDNKAEVERLQTRVDDLASDDPDRFNAIKELKAAREERKQLQAEKRSLDADKQTHAERIKKADEVERDVAILGIAEEYEGVDAAKLTALCTTLNLKSEEQIRQAADTIWARKGTMPESPATPSMKPYSGVTSGGSDNLGGMSPAERVKEADRRLRAK